MTFKNCEHTVRQYTKLLIQVIGRALYTYILWKVWVYSTVSI